MPPCNPIISFRQVIEMGHPFVPTHPDAVEGLHLPGARPIHPPAAHEDNPEVCKYSAAHLILPAVAPFSLINRHQSDLSLLVKGRHLRRGFRRQCRRSWRSATATSSGTTSAYGEPTPESKRQRVWCRGGHQGNAVL